MRLRTPVIDESSCVQWEHNYLLNQTGFGKLVSTTTSSRKMHPTQKSDDEYVDDVCVCWQHKAHG